VAVLMRASIVSALGTMPSTSVFTSKKFVPSKVNDVEISCPDFHKAFDQIQTVSPLAKVAIKREEGYTGFKMADALDTSGLKWKTIERNSNGRGACTTIEKIEDYKGLGVPIVRFRGSMEGPCIGERFAQMIMNLETRKRWDVQISNVCEAYPANDLDAVNILSGAPEYGEAARFGIGYCRTKSNVIVSPREQLTLCGIQEFQEQGSTLIWGFEMEDEYNHLLPGSESDRTVRARTHLFSTATVPTGPNSFDVEYVLQLDIGGKLPSFLTTPVLCETVKSLYREARRYFKSDEPQKFLAAKDAIEDVFHNRKGILFP